MPEQEMEEDLINNSNKMESIEEKEMVPVEDSKDKGVVADANNVSPLANVTEPVYVQLKEEREPSGSRPRSSRNAGVGGSQHKYTLKFYLIDTAGGTHHCATGIDIGDSHYEYNNETGFPFLNCCNKTEVRKWAGEIIQRSQARVGFHTDVVQDVEPPPGADAAAVLEALPTFVSYSEKKETMVDGRHRILWYLLDTEGHNHLAVTGEEKETRDGHYSYHTESVFNRAAPLEAGNQESVKRWLDAMISHQIPPSTLVSGSRSSNRIRANLSSQGTTHGTYTPSKRNRTIPTETRTSSRLAQPRTSLTSSYEMSEYYAARGTGTRGRRGRGRGRGRGRPPRSAGSQSPYTSTPGPISTQHESSSLQRKAIGNTIRRGRGGVRIVDPDRDARELVAAELRRWTNEEYKSREMLNKETFWYLESELSPEHMEIVERCLPILQYPGALPPTDTEKTNTYIHETVQQENLMRLLGALREICHMPVSLSLVSFDGLIEALQNLTKSSRLEVASLANWTLEEWTRSAAMHGTILTDPKYMQDPFRKLEDTTGDRQIFDPIVSAITYRQLLKPDEQINPEDRCKSLDEATRICTPSQIISMGSSGEMNEETSKIKDAYEEGAGQERRRLEKELTVEDNKGTSSILNMDRFEGVEPPPLDEQKLQSDFPEQSPEKSGEDNSYRDVNDSKSNLTSLPSGTLLDAPTNMLIDEDGPHILNDFEQHLAEEGAEF